MQADICGIKLWETEIVAFISVPIRFGMPTMTGKPTLMIGLALNLEVGPNQVSNNMLETQCYVAISLI